MAEMKTRRIKGLGWRRDLPDTRDFYLTVSAMKAGVLPAKVDLRERFQFTPFDQGQLGSCTANAISAAIAYAEQQEKHDRTPGTIPSRLLIYWHERNLEGTVPVDAGAELRDGLKVVNKVGYYDESEWPYDIQRFTTRPPDPKPLSRTRRAEHVYNYYRVAVENQLIKRSLASGYPVITGFTVYSSFYGTGRDGMTPMPSPQEGVEGGHAVLIVGYDDSEQRHIVLNSWGAGWGDKGYFYTPYGYLDVPQYAGDSWAIRRET